MSFDFCNASIIDGIIISCKMIPGIAVNNAPEMKAFMVKAEFTNDKSITWAIPHMIRPDIIDIIIDKYRYLVFCRGKMRYNSPITRP